MVYRALAENDIADYYIADYCHLLRVITLLLRVITTYPSAELITGH
jgi:hypothetical protein